MSLMSLFHRPTPTPNLELRQMCPTDNGNKPIAVRGTHTDDVDMDGGMDGSLVVSSDTRVQASMAAFHPVKQQHPVAQVHHARRQSASGARRPRTATAASTPWSADRRPTHDRRHSALGVAGQLRLGAQFQLSVDWHWMELESFCNINVNTTQPSCALQHITLKLHGRIQQHTRREQ